MAKKKLTAKNFKKTLETMVDLCDGPDAPGHMQEVFGTVLLAMLDHGKDDPAFVKAVTPYLERAFNDVEDEDGFGTEGQCDPRGDQRG